MPSLGLGVREIRIRTEFEHRVLYVTRFDGLVCVIAAFEKRSRKTARPSLELARRRLRLFETEWSLRRT
jgi:phage-related protein